MGKAIAAESFGAKTIGAGTRYMEVVVGKTFLAKSETKVLSRIKDNRV